jgi:hypothetical protein
MDAADREYGNCDHREYLQFRAESRQDRTTCQIVHRPPDVSWGLCPMRGTRVKALAAPSDQRVVSRPTFRYIAATRRR